MQRWPRLSPQLRHAFGRACPYCGASMARQGPHRATRDHVLAKSKGGTHGPHNTLIVCRLCNLHKGAMTLVDFHVLLVKNGDKRASHVLATIDKVRGRLPLATAARHLYDVDISRIDGPIHIMKYNDWGCPILPVNDSHERKLAREAGAPMPSRSE